jgi:aspartate/methionine/tyrosine aminotransferase
MPFIEPFLLERFFAKHEFTAKYLLCASDCEALSLRELLDLEPGSAEGLDDLGLGYRESRGDPALRRDIAALYSAENAIGSEGILVHAGAEEAILNFCLASIGTGDHVVVNEPCYQSLAEIPRSLGAAASSWPLRVAEGRWFLDPDELSRLLRPKTKAVIINLPHNPTGALSTLSEFEAIVALCRKAGALLFVDEVYRHLEREPERRLPAVCDFYEDGVSLNVLSKSAGLAGLRIGWLATRRADILDAVALVKDYNSICSAAPSEFLAGIAVRNFEHLTGRNRALCSENLLILEAFFSAHPGFAGWTSPAGGSIGFPHLGPGEAREFGSDAEAMALRLLADTGVLLLPGAYYHHDASYFRIGYGRKSMPEALARLEKWVLARGW